MTTRSKINTLALCLVTGIALVVGLYFISDYQNNRPNGFVRMFPPHLVRPKDILDIQYNSYYISGANHERIYLGNYTAPLRMISASYNLADTQHVTLQFQGKLKLYPSAEVLTDSAHVYLMEGRTPAILTGKLSDINLHRHTDSIDYFLRSTPLSPQSFILKVVDKKLGQTILEKKMAGTVLRAPNVLEKQVDGVFCTDGMLCYDPPTQSLVYIYFYRNQFIRMDTSLNILYRGKTIDTISHAQVKVARMKSTTTLQSPPLLVNKRGCISGDWIFINSGLRSNNEEKGIFEHCSVIDVYALEDGKYNFSFYLPDFKEKKISGFRVFDKTLVALYDHYLYSYELNF